MENENGMIGDIMADVSEASESQTDSLTFLAWIRVKKGEQMKNPDLRNIAKVLGDTATRSLANGNTKVFNQIGRDATLAIFRHLASGSRKLVNPKDVATLEAMLKDAKAIAKAEADAIAKSFNSKDK